MSVKRYIKINKPIEVDDLVRCTRDDAGARVGHIRKVSHIDIDDQIFFCYHGRGIPHSKHYWEPVIEETDMNKRRRAEMRQEVAEMIVELLDQEDKEQMPSSSVYIANWRKHDRTIAVVDNEDTTYISKLPFNDAWGTLAGVYVALCKATGRELPDWIYGEEKEKTEMSKEITLEDVLRAWRKVGPGLTYRAKVIDQKKGIRFIFQGGIIYEITTERVYSNRTDFNVGVDQSLKAINLTVEYLKQQEGEDGE